MSSTALHRLAFGTLRRLLYLWVKSESIDHSSLELKLDRSQPILYVLQNDSFSDLAVVDRECSKAGLPRPVLPVNVGSYEEAAAFFYLTPDPDVFGRQDKRSIAPALARMVKAIEQGTVKDAQIVPVSVFWGQTPARETSPWLSLIHI